MLRKHKVTVHICVMIMLLPFKIYESLLKKGEAAEVYYNLGNSYYKADDIAKAILNYERALLLQPGNADIRS